jgi:antitoxin FitA
MHASHMSKMIQVRNVPDDLHRRLKARAALSGMSLSEYLLQELRHAAARPTPAELRARLEERAPVHLNESVVEAVRAERDAP